MDDGLDDGRGSELAAYAKCAWARVYDFAMLVTRGDHALAQDVTQSAFLAALPEWPRLRCLSESAREGWLKRVAANKAIDESRCWGTPSPRSSLAPANTDARSRSSAARKTDCPVHPTDHAISSDDHCWPSHTGPHATSTNLRQQPQLRTVCAAWAP
jgi:DNA-directed RNA polymerase specialized sigma24 family protein